MSLRKGLLLLLILLSSIFISSILIWQGLNLDKTEQHSQVLGDQSQSVLPSLGSVATASASPLINNTYLVSKVIDGDTFEIKVNGSTVRVRMVGIDTPETVDPRRPVGCFGKQASSETKRLIEGKRVVLTKDVSETDKYNRLLRYVYLPISDGENLFINDYLIRQGFAKTLTYPPDVKYDKRFLEAEREARENLRGMWGECK